MKDPDEQIQCNYVKARPIVPLTANCSNSRPLPPLFLSSRRLLSPLYSQITAKSDFYPPPSRILCGISSLQKANDPHFWNSPAIGEDRHRAHCGASLQQRRRPDGNESSVHECVSERERERGKCSSHIDKEHVQMLLRLRYSVV
ncbi:hypothetical protein WMY93_031304 [Mugilogobius chulae]|uniref:Uncharacterized protein n=1 Tax=Mugilogobius chulae TaxID=88201 RepID=A0AAW0MG83_9GOBI